MVLQDVPEECEEPRCSRPAAKKWGGRFVCRDHYEQYLEQQDKMMMELRDSIG
jgi:hypothetical protein